MCLGTDSSSNPGCPGRAVCPSKTHFIALSLSFLIPFCKLGLLSISNVLGLEGTIYSLLRRQEAEDRKFKLHIA